MSGPLPLQTLLVSWLNVDTVGDAPLVSLDILINQVPQFWKEVRSTSKGLFAAPSLAATTLLLPARVASFLYSVSFLLTRRGVAIIYNVNLYIKAG